MELGERLITVVHVLGWAFGILGILFIVLMTMANIAYQDSLEQLTDKMKGIKKTWPIGRWYLITLFCWCAVYVTW